MTDPVSHSDTHCQYCRENLLLRCHFVFVLNVMICFYLHCLSVFPPYPVLAQFIHPFLVVRGVFVFLYHFLSLTCSVILLLSLTNKCTSVHTRAYSRVVSGCWERWQERPWCSNSVISSYSVPLSHYLPWSVSEYLILYFILLSKNKFLSSLAKIKFYIEF